MENAARNVFIFTWRIKNFVKFPKISSPVFFVHSIDSGFALELFCTDHQFVESQIGLYLHLVHESDELVYLDFEISCLSLNGSILTSREKLRTLLRKGKSRGFWNFLSLNDVLGNTCSFLPLGTLTLQCKIWKSDGDMSESAVCSARSRVSVERSIFVWPIEGFSRLIQGGTMPYSARKASQGDPTLSMNFQFVHTSIQGQHYELLLMKPETVHKLEHDEDGYKILGFYDLKLSFINVSGEEKLDQEVTRLENNRISILDVLITEELMNPENGYIVNDVLYLKCQFKFYEYIGSEEIERIVYGLSEEPVPSDAVVLHHDGVKTTLSSLEDIHNFLYKTKHFYDVKLQSGSVCIPAHKSILSARSLVFYSMFEGSDEHTVEVSDVTVEVLQQMILFIYTDTVNEMPLEDIYCLFLAADKYKIFALKKACSSLLIGNLNRNNVFEMLCFADEHTDEDLKLAVKSFIVENEIEVTSSTAWKIFKKRNAALAGEVFNIISKDQAS